MVSTEAYPRQKVISYYAFFGGVVGALILMLVMIVIAIIDSIYMGYPLSASGFRMEGTIIDVLSKIIAQFFLFILGIVATSMFGMIIGLVPATITGILIANNYLTKATSRIYAKLFFIGVVSAFIYGFILFWALQYDKNISQQTLNDWQMAGLYGLFFAFLGGISSIIVGRFCLPKYLVHSREL